MTEAVISAAIVGLCSVICQLLINNKNRAANEANLENRLKNIETKLDIHNGYAEKLGDIQLDIAVIKTEIKGLKGDKQ